MSKFFKKAASIALPVIGGIVAGPVGAALGGAAGGAISGGGLKSALIGAGLGYVGGGGLGTVAGTPLSGGLSGPTAGSGILGSLTSGSGGLSSALRSGLQGLGSLTGATSLGGEGILPTITGQASGGIGGALKAGNLASSIYSGIAGSGTADKMAKAQLAGTNKAIEATQPYLTSGLAANTQLSGLLGTGGENKDDILELLRNSPGYQFKLDQGTDAINKSLAARGGLFSGNAIKASQEYGQGLADQTYNDYIRNLMGQAGAGQNAAGAIGDLYQDTGNIGANKVGAKQDAINSALAGVLGGNYEFNEDDYIKNLMGA